MNSDIASRWKLGCLERLRITGQAKKERPPGEATLYLAAIKALRYRKSSYIEKGLQAVRGNVSETRINEIVGTAKYDLGFHAEGLTLLRKAVETQPSIDNIQVLISRLDEKDYFYERLNLYEKLLKIDTGNPYALTQKGWLCLLANQYLDAQVYFEKALRTLPNNPDSHYGLGEVLRKKNDFHAAIEEFAKAIKYGHQQPHFPLTDIAYCFFAIGDSPKAKKFALKALRKHRGYEQAQAILEETEGIRRLGVEWFEAGWIEEAFPFLKIEAMKEKSPGLASLYFAAVRATKSKDVSLIDSVASEVENNVAEALILSAVGATKYDIGYQESGLDMMRRAVALEASDRNILVLAPRLGGHKEFAGEGLSLYDLMLDRQTDNAFALIGRGGLLVGMERFSEAEQCLSRAILLCPDDAEANYELGNLLAFRGEFQKAWKRFQNACRLGYWQAECAWAGMAYCSLKLGDLRSAKKIAMWALEIEPQYQYAKDILQEAGEASGVTGAPCSPKHWRRKK